MRLLGILAFGILGIGVVAEGAVIVSLRRDVHNLSKQVDDARSEVRGQDDGWRPPAGPRWNPPPAPAFLPPPGGPAPGAPRPAAPSAPAAAGAGASADLPLPEALASPEAREQLRHFVNAEMTRAREEERSQWASRRDEAEQRARDRVTKELNLNDDESRKVGEILGNMQQQRRDLMAAVRSGDKQMSDVQPELAALRDKTQSGLKDVLGEDRYGKAQDILRQERGGGPGGGPRSGGGTPAGR